MSTGDGDSTIDSVAEFRSETDNLGQVSVPADKLWGAQTQRPLEHFSTGKDLMPREMIDSYAFAVASTNRFQSRLNAGVPIGVGA